MLLPNNKDIPVEVLMRLTQNVSAIFGLASALIPYPDLLDAIEASALDPETVTDDAVKKIVGDDPEKIKIFRRLNANNFKALRLLVDALRLIQLQSEAWKIPQTGVQKMSPGEEIFKSIINEKKNMYTISRCEKNNSGDPQTWCGCSRCLEAEAAVTNFKKRQVEQAPVPPPRMKPDATVQRQSPDTSFGNRAEQ